MNKKFILIPLLIVSLVIVLGLGVYFGYQFNMEKSKKIDEAGVKSVVSNFGSVLKNVFLLSFTASEDIEKNYKEFVDPVLLNQWKEDPLKALGRQTSSPWPESIEIVSIKKNDLGVYSVNGKIINMTSAGISGSQPIQIAVSMFGERWLITKVEIILQEEDELLKEYNSGGISFQYPEKLNTQYIFTYKWPPTIKIESGDFSCMETSQEESGLSEIISQKIFNGRLYCVKTKNEGAAGNIYSSYTYTAPKNGQLVELNFILRYPSCANYEESQTQVCVEEREIFNLDAIIDELLKTLKWEQVLN
ncbi:hypothetical protein JW698_02520 [Candidatus Wolfebacteria bacterium]|nr:hypothetical protein [Candidatus Wolfebacteria bacterium]